MTGNESGATPGQAARDRLASAVHDIFGADCPNEPCPQCKRREDELMDLADDYAAAAAPEAPDAGENARLRAQADALRAQLQRARELAELGVASGIIDSQALLGLLEAS